MTLFVDHERPDLPDVRTLYLFTLRCRGAVRGHLDRLSLALPAPGTVESIDKNLTLALGVQDCASAHDKSQIDAGSAYLFFCSGVLTGMPHKHYLGDSLACLLLFPSLLFPTCCVRFGPGESFLGLPTVFLSTLCPSAIS